MALEMRRRENTALVRQMNDVKRETFNLPEHTKGQDPSHSSHREAYLDVEQYDGKRVMENYLDSE